MVADSDSNIAWHRVQLKKNRAELKALETARFTMGEIASSKRERPDPEGDRRTQAQDRAVRARDRRSRQAHAPSAHHRPAKPQQRQLEQLGRLHQPAAAQGRPAFARAGVDSLSTPAPAEAQGSAPLAPRGVVHHLGEAPSTSFGDHMAPRLDFTSEAFFRDPPRAIATLRALPALWSRRDFRSSAMSGSPRPTRPRRRS